MREMMWIYTVLTLLLPVAWSQKPALRNFKLGDDAQLTCSNKTWNETLFVIWNIDMKHKQCKIAFSTDGQSNDSCNDGKSLQNTSSAQSHLHIPNFSNDDVGTYMCELYFKGGFEKHQFNLSITVPPKIFAWLETKGSKMVALCKAERGKPAANISWSHTGSLEKITELNDFFTVESRLELPRGMDTQNLSCTIKHPYWKDEKNLVLTLKEGYVFWPYILIVVAAVIFLAGLFLYGQKKLMLRHGQQSNTSPSKSAPKDDVEEIEPYVSYVQRVNSIYDSSAYLFR